MNPFATWTDRDVAAQNAKAVGKDRVCNNCQSLKIPGMACGVCGHKNEPAGTTISTAVERESDLHDQIIAECKSRGWLYFHGSMAHKAMRTLGEPDFTVLANGGRVFFIEAKTKTGKLSTEQLGLQMMAEKLGHKIHVVRSFDEFLKAITDE